jgi:hypothetical protein
MKKYAIIERLNKKRPGKPIKRGEWKVAKLYNSLDDLMNAMRARYKGKNTTYTIDLGDGWVDYWQGKAIRLDEYKGEFINRKTKL